MWGLHGFCLSFLSWSIWVFHDTFIISEAFRIPQLSYKNHRLILSSSSYPNPVSPSSIVHHPFQSEIGKLLEILTHSLYTDSDVFLRELISNAADASEKKTLIANTSASAMPIYVQSNKTEKTLQIQDSGIGMSQPELIKHLGTIAHSGTEELLKQVTQDKSDATSLIGRFGVGFYSSFLVANKVDVYSRKFNESGPAYKWTSTSNGTFTVLPCDDATIKDSGTRIVLHLKDDCEEYLDDYRIKELLRKYSEFIPYPIMVHSEKIDYERVPEESESGENKVKTIAKRRFEWDRINLQPPIWRQPADSLSDTDYNKFYKSTFKAYDEPLGHIHFAVDGQVQFKCLLFVPGTLPWELSRDMFDSESRGVRLYIKRVFVNDKFTESLPRWLTFIRGIIDSEDLPLNIGREILQKSMMISLINQRIATKAIEMLIDIKQNHPDKWKQLYDNFGKYMKVGVVEDRDNKQKIATLIEFWSSASTSSRTDLDSYIKRMKKNQKAIYYITAENRQAAQNSPALEKLHKLGYEVLHATEPIDEFCLSSLGLNSYNGHDVIDVNKSDLKLDAAEDSNTSTRLNEMKIQYVELCDWLKEILANKVQNVIVSERLTTSPAILVQSEFGLSPTMQRYMKHQAATQGSDNGMLQSMPTNAAILEINLDHPIIKQLDKLVKNSKSSLEAKETALLLYDAVMLQGGYPVDDPSSFAKRVIDVMSQGSATSHSIGAVTNVTSVATQKSTVVSTPESSTMNAT